MLRLRRVPAVPRLLPLPRPPVVLHHRLLQWGGSRGGYRPWEYRAGGREGLRAPRPTAPSKGVRRANLRVPRGLVTQLRSLGGGAKGGLLHDRCLK